MRADNCYRRAGVEQPLHFALGHGPAADNDSETTGHVETNGIIAHLCPILYQSISQSSPLPISSARGIAAHFVRYLFFFPKQSNGKKFPSWLILRNWWLIFG